MLLRRFFGIDAVGTSFSREFLAGTTTFVAMAYIVAVNPAILSEAGIPFNAVLFATVFCSVVACILMGLWANKPFALAPGMGMNGYFTYYVVKTLGVPWQTALGIVFVSGILNVLLALSPLRERIVRSIPLPLKNGIAVGVGIFIALIGLRTAGILEYQGVTLQGVGDVFRTEVVLVVVGLATISLLHWFRIRGSILVGMALVTIISVMLGFSVFPETWIAVPSGAFEAFLQLDVIGALRPELWGITIAFFLIDFFSSVGTFIGVSLNTNLLDADGRLPKMREALVADSLATPLGALFGTSSITTYIETAAGVQAGGRTGITALVVAAWLSPMLLLSPVAKVIPNSATAPALIFVGILMMMPLTTVRSYDIPERIAFAALVIATSLTFSIDQGMLYGFSTFIVLKLLTKKWKDINSFLVITTVILLIGKIVQLL